MTEAAVPPAHNVGENQPDEAQVQERVDLDPEREPNAPNRGHETEYVRHDLKDDSSLDEPSDDDALDRPDSGIGS
jgi:hypothetical protein